MKKDKVLQIRLSKEEYDRLKKMSKIWNVSMSFILRYYIKKAGI